MTIEFSPPAGSPRPDSTASPAVHHGAAAAGNARAADRASAALRQALAGESSTERVLLKAAAGAGKSFVLRRLVAEALEEVGPACSRVAIVAFTNKQIYPLATALGKELGKDRVCLFVAKARFDEVPDAAQQHATVVTGTTAIPLECDVVISTSHKLGAMGEMNRLREHFGAGADGGSPFDVLFVDEAWQLPHHLFDKVAKAAPITVGVGDVGQLPPLEVGENPWRGLPGHNPYRAWPTDFDDDPATWSQELPAVWRPAAGHLDLWRAFYPEWTELNCVAAPGDRAISTGELSPESAAIWAQVGTGVPTLLQVDGLPAPEAPDIDLPLLEVVESLLDQLLASGLALQSADYTVAGNPSGTTLTTRPGDASGDPLIAVLATRNQAVDDAADMVERLRVRHGLTETELVASTVDSWQGQTNGITIAIHPLNGADQLDEFNSAFGRLAVTCTRATHGLLMLCRPGLEQLLTQAPARPGTPHGEPGNRQLPRQTHKRILDAFAHGTMTIDNQPEEHL
ncbi:AAA family ATPase [Tomitella biformata]|uniref:AAA family ATPase n=1 Tax=Tomitella biformata TaxID=630403 RepID=UPI000464ECA0|nr:AAA family ATPase [Tomitella biformata]